MKWIVNAAGALGRADKFLADQLPGRGRRLLSQAFDDGRVRVNGSRAKKGQRLRAGDQVELAGNLPDADGMRPVPEPAAPLVVLLEDARVVVLAKPPGMPSHPLRAGETGTLANALVARYPECATAGDDPREGGLAHRLDAGTSGVLCAARDAEAWRALRAAFHEGRAEKEYLALVLGEVTRDGELDAPIAHDRSDRRTVVVCDDPDEAARRGALPAWTRWVASRRFRGYTLLRCTTGTGRMHQVRAHLAHAGTPVVGDERYGVRSASDPPLVGHFLHAARLVLPHPAGGTIDVTAPLPADREAALASLVPIA